MLTKPVVDRYTWLSVYHIMSDSDGACNVLVLWINAKRTLSDTMPPCLFPSIARLASWILDISLPSSQ